MHNQYYPIVQRLRFEAEPLSCNATATRRPSNVSNKPRTGRGGWLVVCRPPPFPRSEMSDHLQFYGQQQPHPPPPPWSGPNDQDQQQLQRTQVFHLQSHLPQRNTMYSYPSGPPAGASQGSYNPHLPSGTIQPGSATSVSPSSTQGSYRETRETRE
jgi:hypothetical protein